MMSVGFLLLLGLIVFGPKKTMEIAQDIGHLVARVKGTIGELSIDITSKEK